MDSNNDASFMGAQHEFNIRRERMRMLGLAEASPSSMTIRGAQQVHLASELGMQRTFGCYSGFHFLFHYPLINPYIL